MSTSSADTPTPTTPVNLQDDHRRSSDLAASAHTDEKSQRAIVPSETPTPTTRVNPDDSECRTHGPAAHPSPSSEMLAAEDDDAAEDDPETPEDGPDDGKGSREAARYRRQLRAVEADRDALTARVEALQRSQVEARVEVLGVKPAALWAAGVEVADLLADDGTVDAEKVTQAVTQVRDTFGIRQPAKPRPRMFRSGASSASTQVSGSNWQAAFSPRGGGD